VQRIAMPRRQQAVVGMPLGCRGKARSRLVVRPLRQERRRLFDQRSDFSFA
jgi:hypothetical protein